MENTEALSIMLKGMDFFDAEDLIIVAFTLGEIKKEKRRVKKTLEMMLKASLLTPLAEVNR